MGSAAGWGWGCGCGAGVGACGTTAGTGFRGAATGRGEVTGAVTRAGAATMMIARVCACPAVALARRDSRRMRRWRRSQTARLDHEVAARRGDGKGVRRRPGLAQRQGRQHNCPDYPSGCERCCERAHDDRPHDPPPSCRKRLLRGLSAENRETEGQHAGELQTQVGRHVPGPFGAAARGGILGVHPGSRAERDDERRRPPRGRAQRRSRRLR